MYYCCTILIVPVGSKGKMKIILFPEEIKNTAVSFQVNKMRAAYVVIAKPSRSVFRGYQRLLRSVLEQK